MSSATVDVTSFITGMTVAGAMLLSACGEDPPSLPVVGKKYQQSKVIDLVTVAAFTLTIKSVDADGNAVLTLTTGPLGATAKSGGQTATSSAPKDITIPAGTTSGNVYLKNDTAMYGESKRITYWDFFT